MNATSAAENSKPAIEFTRKPGDFLSTKQVQSILRSNLGLNAKQATVSKRSSSTYLRVTLRDASVDYGALRSVVSSLSTWSMDNTDYVSGQSVSLEITPEVRAEWGGKYAQAIELALAKITGENQGAEVLQGVMIWKDDYGQHYATKTGGDYKRTTFHRLTSPDCLVSFGAAIHMMLAS